MKIKIIIVLVLVTFISSVYVLDAQAKVKKADIQRYLSDLEGNGYKKLVEVEYKALPEPVSTVSVRINRKSAVIDSFTVPAKIRNIEFQEFNYDRKERIFVIFDDTNNVANIFVYELRSNKLSKVFSASSPFGIETDFSAATRIKIGKPFVMEDSPNRIPDWENWIWCGDKFIKEFQ